VFHAPLISATPGLALAVVASSRGDAVRASLPAVEVIPDPPAAVHHPSIDLVVIATPNDTHAPLAEAALRAGKHVVVDKPFTVTLAEARGLARLAAEVGRGLSVFQNRRWDSDFLGIRREIAAGTIGPVVELRSEMSRHRPEVRDRWRERPGPGAGTWYDLGPHLVDQAMVLFGPPDSVAADLRMQRPGAAATDWFHVVLGYPTTRVILMSSTLASDAPPRFVVRGVAGSLTKRGGDPQEAELVQGRSPDAPGWGHDPDPVIVVDSGGQRVVSPPPGRYLAYYEAVRDAIRSGGPMPVSPSEAAAVMAVVEAGIRSAAEGSAVRPEAALVHGSTTP
jgi:predicted dehydrogenase